MDDGMVNEEDVAAIRAIWRYPRIRVRDHPAGTESVVCWVPRLDGTRRFARTCWDGSSNGYRSNRV